MKLDALQNAARFTRRKRLIQSSGRMGIEIVLDQSDVLGLRIDLIDQERTPLA